jgi:hypothetical protein
MVEKIGENGIIGALEFGWKFDLPIWREEGGMQGAKDD